MPQRLFIKAQNLEIDLDRDTWLPRAKELLAEWLESARVSEMGAGVEEDEASFIHRARRVAPPHLASHFEEMREIFGQGARSTSRGTLELLDVAEAEAARSGIDVEDLEVVEEIIEGTQFVRVYAYGFVAGGPLMVGPFHTARTLGLALVAELAARREGPSPTLRSRPPRRRRITVTARPSPG